MAACQRHIPSEYRDWCVLREALLDDTTELRISPGKSKKLIVIGDLLDTVAVGVDTEGLSQTCVSFRYRALIRALQLLTAFAASWVAGRAAARDRLTQTAT